jgi:hypothetical protein
MFPFDVAIPATVPQGSEIPEGLMNNPVHAGKIPLAEAEWYNTDGRTGGHDEANSRFSQLHSVQRAIPTNKHFIFQRLVLHILIYILFCETVVPTEHHAL